MSDPVRLNFNPNAAFNFSPYGTLALTVNANGTASSAVFTSDLSISANSVLVQNSTNDTIIIAFGDSADGTVAATLPTTTEANNSTPVLAGAIFLFTKRGSTIRNATGGFNTVSVLPGAAAGKVYFTAGDGA